MSLVLDGVSKVYDGKTHIYPTDLTLERGTMNVLLGPTLSGKTTLMRLIGGGWILRRHGPPSCCRGQGRHTACGCRIAKVADGLPAFIQLPRSDDGFYGQHRLAAAADGDVARRGG